MINKLFLLIVSAIFILSCAGDKSSKGKTESNNPTVNSIKKETAKVAQKEVKESKSASTKESTEGASQEQLAKARQILDEVDSPEIDMVDSKKLFKIHCAVCHGFKGDMEINGAKNLVKSRISIEEAVAQVYHGKGLMTPYKGVLSDPEIIAVSQYTETLRR